MTAPAPAGVPRAMHVETHNYIVRSLKPDDATDGWCDWLADPIAQRMLNAKPHRLTIDQVRDYIASFDRIKSHILGIFEKSTGRVVGIRTVHVDPLHKEYLVNVLVGEADARGRGARHETRHAMHSFMFGELGMLAGRCTVLSYNTEMIATLMRNGWVHEHTSRKPAATGEGVLELHHFRLLRETWYAAQAERALRHQTGGRM